nr:hypothetical protein GCM10020092_005840 [Actinoplanes digitatis]
MKEALKSDLVMGNLEQPLTDDTGTSKCGTPPSDNCYAFRSPPAYAEHLVDAGFELMNTANNHSKDFGTQGYRNTVAALEKAGLKHTGAQDQITVTEVKGVRVAVVGFSPYAGANNLNDLDAARAVIKEAAGQADVVVVQVHMGAEGSDKGHVKPGNEIFFHENRGDPIKFSHAVIDARRGRGRRARAARAARHGVLQGQTDRLQPRQLRGRRQDAQQRRRPEVRRRPARLADPGGRVRRRQVPVDLHELG